MSDIHVDKPIHTPFKLKNEPDSKKAKTSNLSKAIPATLSGKSDTFLKRGLEGIEVKETTGTTTGTKTKKLFSKNIHSINDKK